MILKVAILTESQSFKHLCCELIETNSQLTQTGSYINYAFLRRSFKTPDLILTDILREIYKCTFLPFQLFNR